MAAVQPGDDALDHPARGAPGDVFPWLAFSAMYRIDEALPNVREYQALRATAGWGSPSRAACRAALNSTAFGVVTRLGDQTVGMARLVGDTTMYLLIVDVAVHPGHQGNGLGRRMVGELVDWAVAHGTRSTVLIADRDVVPFYEALGFSLDANHLMKLDAAE